MLLGRYTHRVAISNHRLLDITEGKVTFRYKDDARQKTMTLQAEEFIRRFLLHVLPEGFQRIRYCGFLGVRPSFPCRPPGMAIRKSFSAG